MSDELFLNEEFSEFKLGFGRYHQNGPYGPIDMTGLSIFYERNQDSEITVEHDELDRMIEFLQRAKAEWRRAAPAPAAASEGSEEGG